jgi:hypothetical protein
VYKRYQLSNFLHVNFLDTFSTDFSRGFPERAERRKEGLGWLGNLGRGVDGRGRGKLQYMRLIYYFQKESTSTVNLAQSKELRV